MLSVQQLNNLRGAAKHAVDCEKITGVPAELTIAQWAIESGWGQHTPGNNCFGIKDYPGSQGKQLLYTTEFFTSGEKDHWLEQCQGRTATLDNATMSDHGRMRYRVQDWFASFNTLGDCFIKRASLFNLSIYKTYLDEYLISKKNDVTGAFVHFVNSFSPHYATDPKYPGDIFQIASIREVQDAIKEARDPNSGLGGVSH